MLAAQTLRHYSATELIRARVDVRTVAGRLGHFDGGTTLAYYAAWVREADQRASRILMRHLPLPRPPSVHPLQPSRVRPSSPYQVIAAELRTAILAGAVPPGTISPTVTQLGVRHYVHPTTAHRAITVLTPHPTAIIATFVTARRTKARSRITSR